MIWRIEAVEQSCRANVKAHQVQLFSGELVCPNCDSEHVRRSREGGVDRFLSFMGLRAFRCFDCGTRFRSTRQAQQVMDDMDLPPSVTNVASCPNCGHKSSMQLTPEERHLAEEEGWAVSCPQCAAMFPLKRRATRRA